MPTYQVLVYREVDEIDELDGNVVTLVDGDRIMLPVYEITPQPHATLGHTFTLPPALKARLERCESER